MPVCFLRNGFTIFSRVFCASKMSALLKTTISSFACAIKRLTAEAFPRRLCCFIREINGYCLAKRAAILFVLSVDPLEIIMISEMCASFVFWVRNESMIRARFCSSLYVMMPILTGICFIKSTFSRAPSSKGPCFVLSQGRYQVFLFLGWSRRHPFLFWPQALFLPP